MVTKLIVYFDMKCLVLNYRSLMFLTRSSCEFEILKLRTKQSKIKILFDLIEDLIEITYRIMKFHKLPIKLYSFWIFSSASVQFKRLLLSYAHERMFIYRISVQSSPLWFGNTKFHWFWVQTYFIFIFMQTLRNNDKTDFIRAKETDCISFGIWHGPCLKAITSPART